MATTRLQDDLLLEFREGKRMIQTQIEDFEPLAVSLRKPAAQRLAGKGLILFGELLCWLLFLGAVAACALLYRIYPFSLLFRMEWSQHMQDMGIKDVHLLQWSVYGLIGLCGLAFLFLARALARIRQKNAILHMAGSKIKTLVGQHLQRKAALDTIEQRHFTELPQLGRVDVNAVPNPGYDEQERLMRQ